VFKPLAVNAWIGTMVFVVVVPLFLFLCYRVLVSFGMREKFSFSYGQNVFILFNGISQQVISDSMAHCRSVGS
jgi:ACR3 family arsenite efflux pump ArsB